MIDKSTLLDWFRKIDKSLKKKMIIVAVGGTAMTLLGLKPSTIDVDICISSDSESDFKNALDDKFKVDMSEIAMAHTLSLQHKESQRFPSMLKNTSDMRVSDSSRTRSQVTALARGRVFDIFTDGFIFSEQLPFDYIEKSKDILELKNISLKTLSPVDIIITKAARLNARDEEDIKVLTKFVKKDELIKRFNQVVDSYVGDEKMYRNNFEYILKRFFKSFANS